MSGGNPNHDEKGRFTDGPSGGGGGGASQESAKADGLAAAHVLGPSGRDVKMGYGDKVILRSTGSIGSVGGEAEVVDGEKRTGKGYVQVRLKKSGMTYKVPVHMVHHMLKPGDDPREMNSPEGIMTFKREKARASRTDYTQL